MFGGLYPRLHRGVCTLLLVCFCAMGFAQTEGERAIELERQRQEELQRQRELEQQTHTLLPQPTLPEAQQVPESATCFQIRSIEIGGVTRFDTAELESLYQKFLNTCMNIGHINTLVGEITRIYLDAGFITSRAYLPQQNLNEGTLRIIVIEGRVESLEIEGGDMRLLNSAFPKIVGEILNLREIEQGLDVLNQAGAQAKVEFIPGQEIGGTRVLIRYQAYQRVSATLSVDNSGQENTGKNKTNIALNWYHPFKLNDSFYINYQPTEILSEKDNHSESFALGYSLPFGRWKFSANYADFDYSSLVFGSVTSFESWGESQNLSLSAKALLLRNQRSKYFVELQLKQQESLNYIDDILLQTSSRKYQSAELTLSQEKYFGQSSFYSLQLAFTQGLGADYPFANMPDNLPAEDFNKVNLSLYLSSGVQLFGQRFKVTSTIQGQYANQELYSSENLSIGSRYTVRGFNETGLAANKGFYWRNDISKVIHFGQQGRYWEPWIGLDAGRAEEDIVGAALGVKFRGKNVYSDLAYARALAKPDYLEDEGSISMLSLSLNLTW